MYNEPLKQFSELRGAEAAGPVSLKHVSARDMDSQHALNVFETLK